MKACDRASASKASKGRQDIGDWRATREGLVGLISTLISLQRHHPLTSSDLLDTDTSWHDLLDSDTSWHDLLDSHTSWQCGADSLCDGPRCAASSLLLATFCAMLADEHT